MQEDIQYMILEKFTDRFGNKTVEATRAIIFERDCDTSYNSVLDIIESEDLDELWDFIGDKYNLTKMHTVNGDGEPEMPDCLTIREAAEASIRDYS